MKNQEDVIKIKLKLAKAIDSSSSSSKIRAIFILIFHAANKLKRRRWNSGALLSANTRQVCMEQPVSC
jgi:hypothetical protein